MRRTTLSTMMQYGGDVLESATVEDAAKSDIVLTFNDTVTATTAALDWTYSVNGGTDTAPTAAILGSVLTLTMSAPIVYGDTVTVSFANATSDMAIGGVQLEAITDRNVVNNLAASAFNPPDGVVGTVYSYTNTAGLTGPYYIIGFLPNRLSINVTTAEISGTPTEDFNYQHIQLAGSDGESAMVNIVITQPSPDSPTTVADAYTVTDGTAKVVAFADGCLDNDTYV